MTLKKSNHLRWTTVKSVNDNLISLISKIGEKITIRRSRFFDKKGGKNYFYVHSSIENKSEKIVSIVKILNNENKELGQKTATHIAASNPLLAIDETGNSKRNSGQRTGNNKS